MTQVPKYLLLLNGGQYLRFEGLVEVMEAKASNPGSYVYEPLPMTAIKHLTYKELAQSLKNNPLDDKDFVQEQHFIDDAMALAELILKE
jgi:hypothetical protein